MWHEYSVVDAPSVRELLKLDDEEDAHLEDLRRQLRISKEELIEMLEVPPRDAGSRQVGFHALKDERDWLRDRAQERGLSVARYLLLLFRAHRRSIERKGG